MKETFTISKYVYIWRSDETGAQLDLYMEAQMSPKVCVGKQLIVKTIEPDAKEVNLGVVESGAHYTKKSSVTVKTDKGWWKVSYNDEKTWLLGDGIEFPDSM